MINEQDLQDAIAECQGARNPDAKTCIKLASYYTIMDHTVNNRPISSSYSFSSGSSNEFLKLIEEKPIDEVLGIISELMDALKILQPKLYDSVIRKLQS